MYALLVWIHNFARWLLVISGLFVTFFAISGWIRKRQWNNYDRIFTLVFIIMIDIQLVIGLVLFFFYSQWGLMVILNMGIGFVMRNSEYRFFAIEHASLMFMGFIFAHLGNSLLKRVNEPSRKFKTELF